MHVININDFFDFNNHEPVNRIAYTEEDAKYKLRCMKSMQDIGMEIYIDRVGNICGKFKGDYSNDKTLVIGSHTDSVTNGGQFDGPVGVYMALKAAETFKSSCSKQYGNLSVAIYSCEESTRFHSACLGSYYLSGELPYDKLKDLKDSNGVTFEEAVSEYKGYIFSHLAEYGIDLNNIKLVDKIVSENEISEAIESHIEQSQVLSDSNIDIGIIDSIGKPLRGSIYINGENSIVTSAKVISDLTDLAINSKFNNQEETLRITVPQFDSISRNSNKKITFPKDGNLIKINAKGASNHSGATPMDKRKDSVLGLSKLVLKLDELQKENPNLNFEFLGAVTEKWGTNQIQDDANLLIRATPPVATSIVNSFAEDIEEESNVSFDISNVSFAVVQNNPFSELFVDVRQQYPATAENTKETIYKTFKNIQEKNPDKTDSISFRISSQNTPVKTSPELAENIKSICEAKKYSYKIMHSWPGHDLACVLCSSNKIGKIILFFIPSEGGSHNPKEITYKEAVELGTDVYQTLVNQRMNKFKELYEKEQEEIR